MAVNTTPPAWIEPALFSAGFAEVSVEITAHLSAGSDLFLVGLTVYDTATREPLAIEAFSARGSLCELEDAAPFVSRVLHEVRDLLDPF